MAKQTARRITTSEEDEDNTSSNSGKQRRRTTKKSTSSKKKKSSAFNKVVIGTTKLVPGFGSDLLGLASELKAEPIKVTKRIGVRFCMYLWVFAVILSIMSLLGFNVIGTGSSDQLPASSANDGSSSSIFKSFLPGFSSGDPIQTPPQDDAAEGLGEDGGDKPGGDGEDAVPEMQGYEQKKGNKINKAKERQLACVEVDCNIACNKKINPKCAAKKSCRADRVKICKRRCLKARCEERCKDEPKYGYVERESKMEACKEKCSGSTASHNKCIKKCHSEFKPCKSRCHEISMKFQCESKKLDTSSFLEKEPNVAPKKGAKGLKGGAAEESAPSSQIMDDIDDEVI